MHAAQNMLLTQQCLFLQEFFHPQELMEMVVGCQEFDFTELEEV